MPRRAKGPHLWLRPARRDESGAISHAALWFVLDNGRQHGSGIGPDDVKGSERALAQYIQKKHSAQIDKGGARDPGVIKIADVVSLYVRDVVEKHARPKESISRLGFILDYFGERFLSDISRAECRSYVAQRSTSTAARRELEDLRAAINYHRAGGLHDRIVSVVLPDRPPARERWLTRSEAAHLILTTWRYREVQNFRATDRRTRQHVAKFMVVARYMGSRAAVICSASLASKRPAGEAWIDLANGVFYGRPAGQQETKKRRQTVRVPRSLLAHLRRWRRGGQRYVVEWNGRPVVSIKKAHAAAVVSAGFDRDVTPHTWRHSLATWLLQRGRSEKDVAEWLGMTETTLRRVYGHHHPASSADVHDAL